MEQLIGIVPNLTDLVGTLQFQLYEVNVKQVDTLTSLGQLALDITAEQVAITEQQTTLTAKQTLYNNAIAYLNSIGVTDLTKPLTQQQIDTIAAAGYTTTAV